MFGLANLLNGPGTIHAIEEPPERENFDSDEAYRVAWDAWYVRTHCWRSGKPPS